MALSDKQEAQFTVDKVKSNLHLLSDEQVKELEFLLWTECQERFVATGDTPLVDNYSEIRGA